MSLDKPVEGKISMANATEQGGIYGAGYAKGPGTKPVAGPDAEVWVRNQVLDAMKMAIALQGQYQVRAQEEALLGGCRGIAEGAAVEILSILGFSTENLTNLRKSR